MTDTGQVPGEGQPENAGGHPGQPQPAAAPSPADAGPTEQPGMVPTPGEYPYLGQADGAVADDDLLMPGAQGAWSEQPAHQPLPQPQDTLHGAAPQGAPFDAAAQGTTGYEPMPAPTGDHESGGRDSGSVDLGAVRIPQPAAPQPDRARAAAPATPPRRPLHMGPPVPDPTGGVVRSLADRGPAEVPAPPAARHAGPPTGGPEYFDAPAPATPDVPGPAADARTAADLPYAEQPPGEVAAAEQPFAAPSYGEQSYGGQLNAEQTYGAAGQGPLPGPQLGEIPSQVPQWNDAAAQAPAAPLAETVAPEAPVAPAEAVQPAPQDAALPVEQAMPLPVENGGQTGDGAQVEDGAPVAAPTAEAGQEAQAEVPMAPQDGAADAVPDAVAPGQEGMAVAEGAVVEGAAPDAVTADVPAADGAVADVPVQDVAAVDAAVQGAAAADAPVHEAAAPDASVPDAPAPDAPVQDAPGQAPAPDAQQPEDVAAEAPQQPADQDVPAEPEAHAPAQAAEASAPAQPTDAPAPSEAPGQATAPVADQPAADAPAEAPQAPQTEQNAEQTPEQPEAAAEPVATETAAEAQPDAAAVEPQPDPAAATPAEAAPVTPDQATPADTAADAPVAEPVAPTSDTAPQGPVDQPATDDGMPQEQAVIEPSEAPQPAAEQPQPGAPMDAAGQQTTQEPAPEAAMQDAGAPAEQQPAVAAPAAADNPAEPTAPAAEATPGEPAEDAAPAAAAELAEATPDAPAEPLAEARPVSVHIPAQASGEHTPVDALAPQTAAPADEPAPDAEPTADADGTPQQQDAAALVQLGEDEDEGEGEGGDQPQAADQQSPAATSDVADGLLSPAAGYDDSERAAVHRVIRERRDIRNGFRSDPIPNDVLLRVLEAAHTAPSVGHSQPWDFVVIRSAETREKMHQLAMAQREAYAKSLPKARAKQFRELKIEAILETPVNIVVTADSTRGGRHTLGRHTQPQMAPYSSALAVENLWLAARAEGLGVGWVSFFDEREMVRELDLPEHLEVVAYLCIGYVDEFPEDPELLQAGWSKRRPLSWVVHEETYGRRALPGESPHNLLQETLQGIRPLDAKALGEAWERQKRMTKPAGALGMLEIISAQLSGLSRKCPPPIPEPAAVAIFAGDHGVHAQGVTPWPQEVTGQMVANFLGGGAVCNAFANQVGAEVCVVDVGVAGDLPATPGLLPRKVRAGTADFTAGPAMTQEDVLKAIEVGIDTARDLVAAGNKALLTGEMGIANTTTSAALIAVYTGVDPVEVTGRGTGINDETHARKVDVVRRALELHQPDPADPIGVLAAIGGLEHAALVGLILGGASLRTPMILDGVSAGAAALVARAIAPEALAACIAGHRSAEPGHVAALNKLGLRPLVDLDLRLGEGTGALLALPVVQSAARAMHEVATFDSAGVTEKT
ncbi:nicotinate-nucleotide--dimethylbenzimidazole phosphoribosyltransferase [Streptomyces platensis]|uniref:Nicotinate-nucleotide--dimethylbenzimidazole phosphoribosyltransferase n=1 Tax=Streptomyces platensis TaxID=58346 RepID=A0AAE6TL86_STRPT|nr:nicotinate-nucleotide--dimethylbenzimidazole phosphoribosyltransferase [Streptomyces platensis]OSY44316.1 Nicotinate-nucleotide--dimethylbenzimidazole phosphoribosyltransferase [Streptomyces platensis]QEV51511.1 nicotinate-nucleotide--dimethylbenzimidazole phosphoribosyltransferase [Streptomyces platensis]